MKQIIPTEYEECKTLVAYMKLKRLKFAHLANETYTPYQGVLKRQSAMGVSPGIPDYMIIIPESSAKDGRAILVFIEMKRKKWSQVSDHQINWQAALNQIMNVEAKTCYGADQAIEFLQKLLIS